METMQLGKRLVRGLGTALLLLAVGCGGAETPDGEAPEGGVAGNGAAGTAAAGPAGAPPLPIDEAWCGASPCPCQEGSQQNFGNGQVDKCTLAQAHVVQGIPCTAEKPLDFHEDGKLELCFLSAATTLGPLSCAADQLLTFRDSGLLKSCTVTAPVEITGMQCQGMISIHPDGSIKYCNLAREQQVGGHTVPAGQNVEFHPDGHLHRWELVQHTVSTAGLVCRGTMMFYPDGTVAECRRLAEPFSQGEQTVAADGRVCFDPQGQILECSKSHEHIKAFPE